MNGLERRTPTQLENLGFGLTVAAMAIGGIALLAAPAIVEIGTQLAGWKATWAAVFAVATGALGTIA